MRHLRLPLCISPGNELHRYPRVPGLVAFALAVVIQFGSLSVSQAQEAAAIPAPGNAIARLGEAIDAHVGDEAFADASWGIKVVSLDTGKTIYAHDPDKLFVPASTAKLYTAALALDTFGPDHRVATTLFATEKARRSGEISGDLILVGYGDPTLGFDKTTSWADTLATALRKSGATEVRGELIADATWFAGPLYGSGWEAADLQSWFGAPVSALSVDENIVKVEVRPAPQAGANARITFDPPGSAPILINTLRTLRAPAPTDISLYRAPGSEVLHAFGTIASNAAPQVYRQALHDPALVAADQLRAALARQGVIVKGKTRSIYWPEHNDALATDNLQRIADVWSPPISEIVTRGLKVSQNLYLQNLLLMVGAKSAEVDKLAGLEAPVFQSTEALGIQAMRRFLSRIGVPMDGVLMEDGPGLSRRDLTSASALTSLLVHMGESPNGLAFRQGLPEAGVDGSLTWRMRNSAAQGRIHAKTGTMAYTYALAGYAQTAANERLAFSILLNNYRRPHDSGRASAELDAIAILLAELNERSSP